MHFYNVIFSPLYSLLFPRIPPPAGHSQLEGDSLCIHSGVSEAVLRRREELDHLGQNFPGTYEMQAGFQGARDLLGTVAWLVEAGSAEWALGGEQNL